MSSPSGSLAVTVVTSSFTPIFSTKLRLYTGEVNLGVRLSLIVITTIVEAFFTGVPVKKSGCTNINVKLLKIQN